MDMLLGKKVAIFDLGMGSKFGPLEMGRKSPALLFYELALCLLICYLEYYWEIPTTQYFWHKNLEILKDWHIGPGVGLFWSFVNLRP